MSLILRPELYDAGVHKEFYGGLESPSYHNLNRKFPKEAIVLF